MFYKPCIRFSHCKYRVTSATVLT